ncbi:unnamed protein product [Adineta ricciae]|uniref:Uncharacterized protein n=1 Tax=Adineta ricciae TaxID=249248 RepID=A0A814WDD3_ADIRI|nr:unnamed protein product [Adineta ricciae]CAF1627370.1 unnamed protein product [Adineta ricciae]
MPTLVLSILTFMLLKLAIRLKVTGNPAFANESISIMNVWSSTLHQLSGNADRFLLAGIHGYQLDNAAEIMRTYSRWTPEDFAILFTITF